MTSIKIELFVQQLDPTNNKAISNVSITGRLYGESTGDLVVTS